MKRAGSSSSSSAAAAAGAGRRGEASPKGGGHAKAAAGAALLSAVMPSAAPPAPPLYSPSVAALLAARVRPGSVVLFDLDDTLVVATELTRSEPLVRTHRGYATVIQVGPVSCFVAVRAFALASIALLHEAGMRVGFWSAGSPLYVSAVVERLADAVRQMQRLRHERRGGPAHPPELFVPAAVMALDQQAMVWVRDTVLEMPPMRMPYAAAAAPFAAGPRYRQLAPAPLAIKHTPVACSRHPRLAAALPHILLVDNLPHDADFTWHVDDFRPEREGGEDRALMHIARKILRAARR